MNLDKMNESFSYVKIRGNNFLGSSSSMGINFEEGKSFKFLEWRVFIYFGWKKKLFK